MKTIVGVFRHLTDAQIALRELEQDGIAVGDMSLVMSNQSGQYDHYASGSASAAEDKQDVIMVDAAAGAIVGGTAGLVMALTGIVVPGFGAVVAAGWLVSTLTGAALGAAAGGGVGALTGAGIPLEDAIYYREGLHRGDTLLVVRADDERADRVAEILRSYGAGDDTPAGNINLA
jgi:hypothetical protein